jgi:hypothetical protein
VAWSIARRTRNYGAGRARAVCPGKRLDREAYLDFLSGTRHVLFTCYLKLGTVQYRELLLYQSNDGGDEVMGLTTPETHSTRR